MSEFNYLDLLYNFNVIDYFLHEKDIPKELETVFNQEYVSYINTHAKHIHDDLINNKFQFKQQSDNYGELSDYQKVICRLFSDTDLNNLGDFDYLFYRGLIGLSLKKNLVTYANLKKEVSQERLNLLHRSATMFTLDVEESVQQFMSVNKDRGNALTLECLGKFSAVRTLMRKKLFLLDELNEGHSKFRIIIKIRNQEYLEKYKSRLLDYKQLRNLNIRVRIAKQATIRLEDIE